MRFWFVWFYQIFCFSWIGISLRNTYLGKIIFLFKESAMFSMNFLFACFCFWLSVNWKCSDWSSWLMGTYIYIFLKLSWFGILFLKTGVFFFFAFLFLFFLLFFFLFFPFHWLKISSWSTSRNYYLIRNQILYLKVFPIQSIVWGLDLSMYCSQQFK